LGPCLFAVEAERFALTRDRACVHLRSSGGNAARKLDQYAAQKVIHLRAVILRRLTAADLFSSLLCKQDLEALWERWETRSLSFPRLP